MRRAVLSVIFMITLLPAALAQDLHREPRGEGRGALLGVDRDLEGDAIVIARD